MSAGRRSGTPATLLGLLFVLSIAPSPAKAAEPPLKMIAAEPPLKIVVLGDSYSAGNGAGSYYGPEGCYRSRRGWAEQYADSLRTAGFGVALLNRACSGADTQDILNDRVMESAPHSVVLPGDRSTDEAAGRRALNAAGQCVSGFPEEERYDVAWSATTYNGLTTTFTFTCTRVLAAQIKAVGTDADLVLMTMGGTDIHFATLVVNCFVLPSPAGCRTAVETASALLPEVQNRMATVMNALAGRLKPAAKVALVSYPYLEKNDYYTLTSLLPFDSYRAGEEVRKLGRAGDAVQTAAVSASNQAAGRTFAYFVGGVKERFAGHEPDGSLLVNLFGWLHEISLIPAEIYHPNAEGHFAYAKLLLEDPRFGPAGVGNVSAPG